MECYQKRTRPLEEKYGKLTQIKLCNDEIKEKQ